MKTINNNEFKKYLNLKSKLRIQHKNIEVSKVMAIDLAALSYEKSVDFKVILKKILKNNCSAKNFSGLKKDYFSNRILVTCTTKRSDYLELVKAAMADVRNSTLLPTYELKNKFTFSLNNIVKSLNHVFKKDINELGLIERIYVASSFCYCLNSIDELGKEFQNFDFKNKKFLSFNSAHRFDTLLTLYFRHNGMKTYSLSHGLSYVDYFRKVPMDNINGENITAETVFVWGRSSKTDLVKNHCFNPDKIVVAGNPKYPQKKIAIKQSFKSCLILMGRNIYDKGNKEILNIACNLSKETDISFQIKLHPSLDLDKYSKYCKMMGLDIISESDKTVSDLLRTDQFDFAVVNNSTAYYEAMYYDAICFRFEPDINEDYIGLRDKFEDIITLKKKIKYFRNHNTEKLNSKVTNLLVETLGMGINNYKKYLD